MWLQSHLQTFPPTPRRLYLKFRNPRTTPLKYSIGESLFFFRVSNPRINLWKYPLRVIAPLKFLNPRTTPSGRNETGIEILFRSKSYFLCVLYLHVQFQSPTTPSWEKRTKAEREKRSVPHWHQRKFFRHTWGRANVLKILFLYDLKLIGKFHNPRTSSPGHFSFFS